MKNMQNMMLELKSGLARTRVQIGGLFGGGKIDAELYEEWKRRCFAPTRGRGNRVPAGESAPAGAGKKGLTERTELKAALREALAALIAPLERAVAARGTSSFHHYAGRSQRRRQDHLDRKAREVFPGPGKERAARRGDTFRAAAREQLAIWGERNQVAVITQQGGDPAAVIFDAIQAARARKIDMARGHAGGCRHSCI